MVETARRVAQQLLAIGAVGFNPDAPVTFKSGITSPVYVDNRKLPYHPEAWNVVILGLMELVEENHIKLDVIAGVEAAGIPHSAALGRAMMVPSVFVRKEAKAHGLKKRVEGGPVEDLRVVLTEDHITTASSSLDCVQALRDEKAIVNDCLAITTYGFAEADAAFVAAGVVLHALTQFSIILDEAIDRKQITEKQRATLSDWFKDPHGWGERYGFITTKG